MYFSNSHFREIKFSSPLLIETIEPLDKQIIHKINLLHTRICFSFCSNILFKYFPFYLSFLPFFYLTLIKNNPTLISNKTKKIVFTNFRNLFKKKKKNITQDQNQISSELIISSIYPLSTLRTIQN